MSKKHKIAGDKGSSFSREKIPTPNQALVQPVAGTDSLNGAANKSTSGLWLLLVVGLMLGLVVLLGWLTR